MKDCLYSSRDCLRDVACLIETAKKEPQTDDVKGYIDGLTMAFNHIKCINCYSPNTAEIHEHQRMTNRQLAELLIKGYGQTCELTNEVAGYITSWYDYYDDGNIGDDTPVDEDVRIRAWGSDDWEIPYEEVYYKFLEEFLEVTQ